MAILRFRLRLTGNEKPGEYTGVIMSPDGGPTIVVSYPNDVHFIQDLPAAHLRHLDVAKRGEHGAVVRNGGSKDSLAKQTAKKNGYPQAGN